MTQKIRPSSPNNDKPDWKLNLLSLIGSLAFGGIISALMYSRLFYLAIVVCLYLYTIFTNHNRKVWQSSTMIMYGLFFWYFVFWYKFQGQELR